MKRRSFLSLFGLVSVPSVVLAQPRALRCGCTGECSSEECGAGLPDLPPTCGAHIIPELDVFQDGRWICRPCEVREPASGWGWEIITLQGTFDEIVTEDLWARRLTWSTAGDDPPVDFVMEVRGDALYQIAPTPSPVKWAGDMFDCVAPQGIRLRRGSRITGHIGAPARLQLHCLL